MEGEWIVTTEQVQDWLEADEDHTMTESKIAQEISTVFEQQNSDDEDETGVSYLK